MAKLYDRLTERAKRDTLRGHMPGHKGLPLLVVSAESIDFTELSDTGNLYDPEPNIIREAEEDAARATGADHCVYSAGGSTLLIQGMLGAAARRASAKGRPLSILAARDAHRAFFAALGMLGGEVDYIYPEYIDGWNISRGIRPEEVKAALSEGEYDAVYVTSPNYYGVMSDIPGISKVCAEAGELLLVDAAHGAHLVWDGALFNVDRRCETIFALSAHKTLGSLGGGAFALGIGGDFEATKRDMLESMQLFGSSSPSYVVMASLDKALAFAASGEGKAAAAACGERVRRLRETLSAAHGLRVLGEDTLYNVGAGLDPCRLVFSIEGMSGFDAADRLERDYGVAAEMADARNLVFIMTAADDEAAFTRLEAAILDLAKKAPKEVCYSGTIDTLPRPETACSVREALLSPAETVKLRDAEGRIAAEAVAPYPPGVPVITPGEKISQKMLAFLAEIGYNVDKELRVLLRGPSKPQ